MRNTFPTLALATAAFSAFAAGPTSATAIDAKAGGSVAAGRMVVPLDFGWRFHWGKVDGDPRAATFDDSGWRIVDLPHDAQFEQPWTQDGTCGARGFKPMGEMWYRKRFVFSEEGIVNSEQLVGKRVFLELGGLLCVGDVYLNGKFVGSTDYGYLPVWADLTAALNKNGENTLAVWCSTGKTGGSRWYTGAGLYRDAKLVVKPEIAIARHGVYVKSRAADIRMSNDGCRMSDAILSLTVELDGFRGMGGKSKLDVVADIKDAKGSIVATAQARAPWSKLRHQEVSLPDVTIKGARLWDVDSPNLYTADVRLVLEGREIDRDAVRFGVRTVELDPAFGMKLNGRKVFLKSMSNHHDLGLVGAAAYRRAIRRQFETMKAFGYNAVRCSHNPYSEEFYDLADEMGVLVLDELIDKWSDKSWWFGRKPFTTIWPHLVTEWIKRDRNHPSVFAWSFGNELQMNEDLCGYSGLGDWGVTMYRVLKTFAQRWDDTRPTTVAMFPAQKGARGKNDPKCDGEPEPPELACATDFASFNYRWMDYASYRRHVPHLNIFQSEAAVRELQAPYVGMDHEHTIGCSWWGAVEYWGESNGWPKKGWNFALFSHCLEPYPSAYLIKSVISDEPVVRIAVESGKGESVEWNDVKVGVRDEESAWEGRPGEVRKVRVYTNCESVELFLNGRSIGVKSNDDKSPKGTNVVSFDVPFEPGELKAVGTGNRERGMGNGYSHSVRTFGAPVALKVEVEGGDFTADGHDLIYVRCRAVDANGVQVLSATNRVAFSCTGAARFLACDNGDHYTGELFTSDITAKNMKRGFILAAFRTGTVPGEATITITPEGLPEARRTIKVGEVK